MNGEAFLISHLSSFIFDFSKGRLMRLRFVLFITLLAPSLFAVAPQFWRVRNVEDFLAGDIDGFAVTSRGDLRAGPTIRKVASFPDPFVLSQASGANGD